MAILEEIQKNRSLLQTQGRGDRRTSEEGEGQDGTATRHVDMDHMCARSIEDLLRHLCHDSRHDNRSLDDNHHNNRTHDDHHHDNCRRDDKPAGEELPLERTSSLPPLSQKQPLASRHSAPTTGTQHPHDREEEEEGEGGKCENVRAHVRSKSHGESDYRRLDGHGGKVAEEREEELCYESCQAEAGFNVQQQQQQRPRSKRDRRCGNKCTCENKGTHNSAGGGGGRRKRGRSRSDGYRHQHHRGGSAMAGERDRDGPVDPSLDDDGPGIPENRIRRPRYLHHHQHQHQVCRHCLGGVGGPENRPKGAAGGGGGSRRRHYSPDLEHVGASRFRTSDPTHTPTPPGPSSSPPAPSGPPTLVMTLEDMRSAALLLEKSTEFVECESPVEDDNQSPHHQVKGHLSEEEVKGRPESSMLREAELCGGWQDLRYRSGRDSPATDMAVACLDMNSSRMLQPLTSGGSMQGGWGEGPEGMASARSQHLFHLHSHHHYHHIIHHHSQP